MFVNFRVEYHVEMLLDDGYPCEISDLLILMRPGTSCRIIGRELWDSCIVRGWNETRVFRRFDNTIGVLNRTLAEESAVSP